MNDSRVHLPSGLIEALARVHKVLVLSGAGMSAESGVPTFRDAQQGLWARYRPEDLATPEAFRKNPATVWNWYQSRRDNIRNVRPHAGHGALVSLERLFDDFLVVTQNVDGLHQYSGSSRVVELHGNIMRSVCHLTGKPISDEVISNADSVPPVSPHHPDGLARPDVVWFGESLPAGAMNRACEAAAICDLCISVGTSSLVQPAASLPYLALDSGALLMEINPQPTPLSAAAHFCLQSTAATALPALLDVVQSERGQRDL